MGDSQGPGHCPKCGKEVWPDAYGPHDCSANPTSGSPSVGPLQALREALTTERFLPIAKNRAGTDAALESVEEQLAALQRENVLLRQERELRGNDVTHARWEADAAKQELAALQRERDEAHEVSDRLRRKMKTAWDALLANGRDNVRISNAVRALSLTASPQWEPVVINGVTFFKCPKCGEARIVDWCPCDPPGSSPSSPNPDPFALVGMEGRDDDEAHEAMLVADMGAWLAENPKEYPFSTTRLAAKLVRLGWKLVSPSSPTGDAVPSAPQTQEET